MNEFPNDQGPNSTGVSRDEEALLESALTGSDNLLRRSLREEERRRRWRRLTFFTVIGGIVVMTTALLAVLAGLLTLTPPPDSGAPRPKARAASSRIRDVAQADQLAQQGWQLWQAQNFAQAANVFEEASQLDPESANIWNGLGWARFNSGDSEAAVTAFEKCAELERNHPAALNGLGQIYLSWGEFPRAEKFLKRAAAGGASAAWFGLARLNLLTGKYDEAQKWIEKSLGEQPGDPTLTQMREAAQQKKLPETLRRQLQPVGRPKKTPDSKAAADGWRHFNSGNFRAAELSFNRALAKDPENLSAMNGLGFLLVNSGKVAEAKKLFERYLEIEPDAAGPMNGLARCLKAEGKVDEAIELWTRMHELYPGPNAAAVGLGMTYLERKEYDKALPFLAELAQAQPDNAEFKKALEEAEKHAQK